MNTAFMLKLLLLVKAFFVTTNAQVSQCARSPQGQDAQNGAYIRVTSLTAQGYRCQMRLCPTGNPVVTNATYISAIKAQMCPTATQQNLLGCVPDTYVASVNDLINPTTNLVSTNWYNTGCEFCKCDMNLQVRRGEKRQPGSVRYVQFNNAGQECQILECGYTSCYPPTDPLGYAYFPKPNATNPIWFPNTTDEFAMVPRSRWTEFDVPNSYACPSTMASSSSNLCDVSNVYNSFGNRTLWKGTKYFQWVPAIAGGHCEIKTCDGANVFSTFSTSQISSTTIVPKFRNYIRGMCATQLRGCYNDEGRWRYNSTAARSSDCVNGKSFCNQIYCSCSPVNSTGYSVRRISQPFTGVGMELPVSSYACEEYQCDLTGKITTPKEIETSQFIPIPAAECPNTNKYYVRSGILSRGSQNQNVPMAYRQSSNPTMVTLGVTSQYFCSSLGYQLPTPQKKCYRSPLYSILAFSSIFSTVNSGCRSTGNCSHTHGRNLGSSPTCQELTKSTKSTTYQYAPISAVDNIDNNWVEYQCFPNASNFRMESICESTSSNLLWDTAVTSGQLAGEPKRCLDGLEARKIVQDYNCGELLLLADNKCEYPQISNYVKLQAECACKHVASQNAGGDSRYAEQAKSMVLSRFSTTLVNALRPYGCTYRFSCNGGSATVKMMKPQVSGRFIVQVPCDEVNWGLLKTRLEAVLSRYNRVQVGSQQGVILDMKAATGTTTVCKVPFKTLMQVPELADWFIGNLTSKTSSAAFAPNSYENVQVTSLVFSATTVTLPSWLHVFAGLVVATWVLA